MSTTGLRLGGAIEVVFCGPDVEAFMLSEGMAEEEEDEAVALLSSLYEDMAGDVEEGRLRCWRGGS